jgi:hypothetical protein
MKQTLMSELAGDFSFSLRAGSGIHLHIRKSEETAEGFRGVIENAFWMNGNGEQLKTRTRCDAAVPLPGAGAVVGRRR